jgi:hypothetical protein
VVTERHFPSSLLPCSSPNPLKTHNALKSASRSIIIGSIGQGLSSVHTIVGRVRTVILLR